MCLLTLSVCTMYYRIQDTERLFGMAANHMITVKGLTLSSDQRLELYSLFKQATEGDCEDPKPGLIDLVGRAKWCVGAVGFQVPRLGGILRYLVHRNGRIQQQQDMKGNDLAEKGNTKGPCFVCPGLSSDCAQMRMPRAGRKP